LRNTPRSHRARRLHNDSSGREQETRTNTKQNENMRVEPKRRRPSKYLKEMCEGGPGYDNPLSLQDERAQGPKSSNIPSGTCDPVHTDISRDKSALAKPHWGKLRWQLKHLPGADLITRCRAAGSQLCEAVHHCSRVPNQPAASRPRALHAPRLPSVRQWFGTSF
jgi:hypothetical protein